MNLIKGIYTYLYLDSTWVIYLSPLTSPHVRYVVPSFPLAKPSIWGLEIQVVQLFASPFHSTSSYVTLLSCIKLGDCLHLFLTICKYVKCTLILENVGYLCFSTRNLFSKFPWAHPRQYIVLLLESECISRPVARELAMISVIPPRGKAEEINRNWESY